MKKICMFGRNGFIGKTVLEEMQRHFPVQEVGPCDVLVNCAGFSVMHEARKSPEKMQAVEDMIFERIAATQFDRLIHLSTIYTVANPTDAYSRIKRDMESRILGKYKDVVILRLGSVLGKGLKKNVIFDLMHDQPLWVTPDSVYNYISTTEVALIIMKLIDLPVQGIVNVGASESITASETAALMGKTPVYGKIKDHVLIDISQLRTFYDVKTSREYIKEFYEGVLQ